MLQADLIVSGRPRHAHAEHPALGPERIASSWPTSDSWVASSQSSSLTTAKQQKKIPQHDNCHGLPLDGIGRNTHHRHRPAMLTFWLLTTSCLLLSSLDTCWPMRGQSHGGTNERPGNCHTQTHTQTHTHCELLSPQALRAGGEKIFLNG